VSAYFPDATSLRHTGALSPAERFRAAFRVAEERAGVRPMLDVDDLLACAPRPDKRSVMMYVAALWAGLAATSVRASAGG
jgi:hypothetical protein